MMCTQTFQCTLKTLGLSAHDLCTLYPKTYSSEQEGPSAKYFLDVFPVWNIYKCPDGKDVPIYVLRIKKTSHLLMSSRFTYALEVGS